MGQNIAREVWRWRHRWAGSHKGQSLSSGSKDWGCTRGEINRNHTVGLSWRSSARGCGFGPWSGTKIPHTVWPKYLTWHQVLVQWLAVAFVLNKIKETNTLGSGNEFEIRAETWSWARKSWRTPCYEVGQKEGPGRVTDWWRDSDLDTSKENQYSVFSETQ